MNDLERSVRQTLRARVEHLTDEQLDADVADPAAREPRRRSVRARLVPLAAAAAVAAVAIGVIVAVNGRPPHKHGPVGGQVVQPEPPLVGTWWNLQSLEQDGKIQQAGDIVARLKIGENGEITARTGATSSVAPRRTAATTSRSKSAT